VEHLAAADIEVSYPIFQTIFGEPSLRGRQAVKEFANGFGQRWSDPRIAIEEAVEAGDRVVLRWSYRARNVGTPPGGPPPTNRLHSWTGITIYRFDGTGKIVSEVGEESDIVLVENEDADDGEE
jgi:hypothetical protein